LQYISATDDCHSVKGDMMLTPASDLQTLILFNCSS